MEEDMNLMRMVQEMRSEIDKLERENKALRGELNQLGSKTTSAKEKERNDDDDDYIYPLKEEIVSRGVLRRNASVGSAPISQEQKGVTMTVRRYSLSSSLPSSWDFHRQDRNIKRYSSSGTLVLNGSLQDMDSGTEMHVAKSKEHIAGTISENVIISSIPKTRSFQEYVQQCRGKVKAVTFLLPVDMRELTENQKTFQGPQNQSANHLSTILEKDP